MTSKTTSADDARSAQPAPPPAQSAGSRWPRRCHRRLRPAAEGEIRPGRHRPDHHRPAHAEHHRRACCCARRRRSSTRLIDAYTTIMQTARCRRRGAIDRLFLDHQTAAARASRSSPPTSAASRSRCANAWYMDANIVPPSSKLIADSRQPSPPTSLDRVRPRNDGRRRRTSLRARCSSRAALAGHDGRRRRGPPLRRRRRAIPTDRRAAPREAAADRHATSARLAGATTTTTPPTCAIPWRRSGAFGSLTRRDRWPVAGTYTVLSTCPARTPTSTPLTPATSPAPPGRSAVEPAERCNSSPASSMRSTLARTGSVRCG